MGALKNLREKQTESRSRIQETIDSLFPKTVSSSPLPTPISQSPFKETVEQDSQNEFSAPPVKICRACGSSVVWASIYKPKSFSCIDCNSPPEFFFVNEILWLVIDENGNPEWEYHPRSPKKISLNFKTENGKNENSKSENDSQKYLPAVHTFKSQTSGEIIHTVLADFRNPKNLSHWNDLTRLTYVHGFDQAWRMLQDRTETKLGKVTG